jgi:hypothetical protein
LADYLNGMWQSDRWHTSLDSATDLIHTRFHKGRREGSNASDPFHTVGGIGAPTQSNSLHHVRHFDR